MHLTKKSQIGEYRKSSVDGDQANFGMFQVNSLIDGGRSKVLMAQGDYRQHLEALRSKFITVLS